MRPCSLSQEASGVACPPHGALFRPCRSCEWTAMPPTPKQSAPDALPYLCRHLRHQSISGTLPREWSTLTALKIMCEILLALCLSRWPLMPATAPCRGTV